MIKEATCLAEIGTAEFVFLFIGPVAYHNYLCAVCRDRKAVLVCNTGVLEPCWECKDDGYSLVKLTWFDRYVLGRK